MTRGEFVSRLEKLNKDTDWDKAYKFFERQSGQRTETSKEVLRNSWVFDVVFHIYHGVGTSKITKSFRLINKLFLQFNSTVFGIYFKLAPVFSQISCQGMILL